MRDFVKPKKSGFGDSNTSVVTAAPNITRPDISSSVDTIDKALEEQKKKAVPKPKKGPCGCW